MTTLKLSELLRYRLGGDTIIAPAGGYVHHQNVSAALWVVNHNLGQKYVVVEVIRNDNLSVTGRYDYPTIDFVDNNTLTVAFNYTGTGHVVVAAGSVKGEKGEQGNIVAAGSYVHDQQDPDTVWNIQHNLGQKYVSVELVDEYDTVITGRYDHPTITYVDENNIFVAFSYPKAGKGVISIGSGGNISVESGSNVFLANASLTVGTVTNLYTTGGAGGDYGNANVAGYLASQNISSANIGAYQTFANSNAATQATSINSITANLGAYQNYGNLTFSTVANATSQAADITTLLSNAATQATSINSITANLGAYQTYGNLTFSTVANAATQATSIATLQTQVYANANVNTYLSSSVIGSLSTSGNLTVGGNLIVNGNTTVINTATYTIDDNILQIADGNPADSLDLGFVGHRTVGAVLQHTGLVRDASADNWRLFSNVRTQPGATIDFTNAVYDDLVVGNISANIVKNGYTWNFGTDGALTLPASSGQIGRSGYTNGIDLYNDNGGTGYVRMNYADESFVWADSGGAHVQTSGANTWDFGTDANLTLPETGYLKVGTGIVPASFAASPAPVISGFSSISAENFRFQGNGVNILSTVASTYSNTQANALLSSNTVSTISTTGNITTIANVIAPRYLFANGVNILSTVTAGSTYSNANVVANLANFATNIVSTANVTASYFVGNGSALTGIQANLQSGNIYGTSSNVTLVAGSYSSVFGNTGMVTMPNVTVSGNVTIGNVTTTMATTGYNNWKGNTYANVDNISASVFSNGSPAFSSVSGTLNYFWSSVTNLTGGKFFGNTSTGGAITTSPTVLGTGITLGSGGDTVIVTLQDQDLRRMYTVTYAQTVGAGNCAIVAKRIL